MPLKSLCLLLAALPTLAIAQACPERSLYYWQAFPAGGESDISGRHQQAVLKTGCPAIETIIQYKPGAGGGLMWSQMNTLPADGYNIIGINLPHIVLQPMEGQVQYKTEDVTPVYWYHFTPDALVVAESSPASRLSRSFVQAAKSQPDRITLGGSGLNSANHAAHERLNAAFGVKTTYIPFKRTGDMTTAVIGGHVGGARCPIPRLPSTTKPRCAHWRSRWTSVIPPASRHADLQGARGRLGRRRLSRHRHAEGRVAGSAQAPDPTFGLRSTQTPR